MTHAGSVQWDPKVSMMYLEPGVLFQYTRETNYFGNPTALIACPWDPRGPTDGIEKPHEHLIHHNETMLLLDRFHHGANNVWLDVLHPLYGRCWIRGNYEYGLDPRSRVFLPV